ncbi:MAG TPA: sigma-54-dependent Fis family transcriptional regulator [Bdellovibrionales bacterium]|nr:two-component system response regulator [Pseudobdellovibrionaceae bacterium]HAG90729.1 sigma-54-dependent Fis family transcriptional regulator [Bdellovibrionales bacterium]|tara:strand:- start:481 stop:1968 length:1488 start_codon:yes stop_codon:yes gene_type:complete
MLKVLVADDDATLRLSVTSALLAAGDFQVEEAVNGQDAIDKFKAGSFQVVLLDVDMPQKTGLEALKEIKEEDPSAIVLIMTAYANVNDAVHAVKEGAFDYLSKPVKEERLLTLVRKAIEAHSLISRVAASAPEMSAAERPMIGRTGQMQKVFHIIHRLSKVDTPVLVRGPSGTGKELVAQAIHHNSSFKEGKFVAINCSAIPENLFESELFGHEKGSFTGADQRKIGKFQFAEGGTLFLDEVGDMPLLMQVKLLRVLQEKLFTPIGSNREIQTHVRIIAATNRPLEEMIQKGEFREDLYYRLNVMPIFLPPLKDRREDLGQLIDLFVNKFNRVQSKKIQGPSPDALNVLKKYDWPGNIRELENVIEHAFILEESSQIQLSSLPEKILMKTGIDLNSLPEPKASQTTASSLKTQTSMENSVEDVMDIETDSDLVRIPEGDLDFNKHKEAFEKEFIVKALKMFKGRINQTALHANIPKKTLLRKIEKYGIVAKDYAD